MTEKTRSALIAKYDELTAEYEREWQKYNRLCAANDSSIVVTAAHIRRRLDEIDHTQYGFAMAIKIMGYTITQSSNGTKIH